MTEGFLSINHEKRRGLISRCRDEYGVRWDEPFPATIDRDWAEAFNDQAIFMIAVTRSFTSSTERVNRETSSTDETDGSSGATKTASPPLSLT